LGFAGCNAKAEWYTIEEHIERISKRVEKRYFGEDSKYEFTDYEVFPLYNEKDEFANYCVVEFEPYGYIYVEVTDKTIGHGMYLRRDDNNGLDWEWQRYRINENGETPEPYNGNQWSQKKDKDGKVIEETLFYEVDESIEFIYRKNSHFKEANIVREKRYLLRMPDWSSVGIPAVRRGDKFLNLISMEEFRYEELGNYEETPCDRFTTSLGSFSFDL
jgi:hypothetical protein